MARALPLLLAVLLAAASGRAAAESGPTYPWRNWTALATADSQGGWRVQGQICQSSTATRIDLRGLSGPRGIRARACSPAPCPRPLPPAGQCVRGNEQLSTAARPPLAPAITEQPADARLVTQCWRQRCPLSRRWRSRSRPPRGHSCRRWWPSAPTRSVPAPCRRLQPPAPRQARLRGRRSMLLCAVPVAAPAARAAASAR
jgi:hypothetical protein